MQTTTKTYRGYAVQEQEAPTRFFIALRETTAIDKLSEGFAKHLPTVFGAVHQAGIEMAGMPCGLYFNWDEATQTTDVAYGIPVKTATELPGFETITIPNGKVIALDYFGSYDNLKEAHQAIDDYFADQGLEMAMPVYEEYVTDPGTEPDPTKWLTKIVYPIQIM